MKLIRKKMLTLYQKICAELDENKSPEKFCINAEMLYLCRGQKHLKRYGKGI